MYLTTFEVAFGGLYRCAGLYNVSIALHTIICEVQGGYICFLINQRTLQRNEIMQRGESSNVYWIRFVPTSSSVLRGNLREPGREEQFFDRRHY
jgi:hypothetical protein